MSDIENTVLDDNEERGIPVITVESPENIKNLKSILAYNLNQYESAFDERDQIIEEIIKQREMSPKNMKRDINGRLPSVPPVTASACNIAYSHVKNYFNSRYPFWDAKSVSTDKVSEKQADIIEKYLNMLADSRTDLNLRGKNNTIIYDYTSLGTKFVIPAWDTSSMQYKFQGRDGNQVEMNYQKHFGCSLITMDTRDVRYPPGFDDVNDTPWIARKVLLSKAEYRRMSLEGLIRNYEENDTDIYEEPADADIASERLDESSRHGEEIDVKDLTDFWEFYIYYEAVDDNGESTGAVCDYIVWYHRTDDKILKIEPNTLGERPIIPINYVVIPGSLGGLGVGHFTRDAQNTAEYWNNVRQKNAEFSVNKTFIARMGSVHRRIELKPGGILFYSGNGDDIPRELSVRDVPGSSVEFEERSMRNGQLSSGISSIMGGMPDPTLKSRDTFAGQNLRNKIGMGIIGAVIENAEYAYAQIANIILKQLILHKDEVMAYENTVKRMSEEDLSVLESVLNVDIQLVPVMMKFGVKTTDLDQTADAVRQNYLLVSQLTEQYFQSMTPYIQMLDNPQLQQMPNMAKHINQMIVSKTEIFEKILKDLNISDKDHIIPNVDLQVLKLEQTNMMISQMVEQLRKTNLLGGANGQGTDSTVPGISGINGGGMQPVGQSVQMQGMGGLPETPTDEGAIVQ